MCDRVEVNRVRLTAGGKTKDGKHRLIEVVPAEKTLFPAECKFTST